MRKFLIALIPALFSSTFFSGHSDKEPTILHEPISQCVVYTYCDEGENEDPQPMLSGHVQDEEGNDIYHGCVEIKTTLGVPVDIIGTDSLGHYFFNSVSNGNYNLVVSAVGYTSQTIPFTVSGSPQTINVVLE